MRLTIIIPAYNEERRIVNSLNRLLGFLELSPLKDSYEVLVAADGCTDRTVQNVEKLSAMYESLKVLDSPRRLGKGGGILEASTFARGSVLAFMDVDLPVTLEKLMDLIGPIENNKADLVIGSRYLPDSRISRNFPMSRRIASKIFNGIVRILFKISVSDAQCGFKAFNTNTFRRLLPSITARGYAFDVDILVAAKYFGQPVCEISVDWTYSPGSKLKLSRDSLRMFLDVYRIWMRWRSLRKSRHGSGRPDLTYGSHRVYVAA